MSARTLAGALTAIVLSMIAARAARPETSASVATEPAEAAAHIAAAHAAAGSRWKEAADYFCGRDPQIDDPQAPLLEPTKIFENLYVIGRAGGTAMYVIPTSEGLVMIDSGYPDQLESVLLAGFAKLRLNPADVKYLLVGHGIWDHWGGAAYFQNKYNTRVLMGSSAPGWEAAKTFQAEAFAAIARPGVRANKPPPGTVAPKFDPRRDIMVSGETVLTVGETSFTIMDAPGGIGIVFPVRDGATTHMAALFGATILAPSWRNNAGLQEYLETLNRWAELTARLNVDVEIQNHPIYDGIAQKVAGVRAGKKGSDHPFVVGKDGYQRFITVMAECAQTHLARRAAGTALPFNTR